MTPREPKGSPSQPSVEARAEPRPPSDLSIDLEGRLCHRGEPITHARTLEVLWSSLRREPYGRYTVRVGRECAEVAVVDAPYGVRGVTAERQGLLAHLTDGSTEPLDPATLTLDAAGVLHCRVKGGSHRARLTRAAQVGLGLLVEESPDAPGRFVLRLGAALYPIAPEP